MPRDYYAILGVQQGASDAELKRAYRKLARELHPDVNPHQEAQVQFKEISLAYEVLSDPEKRRIVDLGGDPMESGGGGGFSGFGGLGDVFEAFFGGGRTSAGPKGRVQPGEDALVRLVLDLEECAEGVIKEINVDTAVLCDSCAGVGSADGAEPIMCTACKGTGDIRSVQRSFLGQVVTSRECRPCRGVGVIISHPCVKCGGDGRVRARKAISVQVPAGVGEGMRIRLAGQGEVGPGGGAAGDLYVEIRERNHDIFVRDGVDLHCSVDVPMVDAALGAVLEIATVLGMVAQVRIEPGSKPGSVVTVPGHGMPKVHSDYRGALYVHLEVVIPTKLSDKQIEYLRQFKESSDQEVKLVHSGKANSDGSGFFARLRNSFSGR